MSLLIKTLLLSLVVLLGACSQDQAGDQEGLDPVLVTVDGYEVKQSQLDLLIQRLPVEAQNNMTDSVRQKMIESLVRITVLSKEAEKQLDQEDKILVDAKVQAYRDELLAQIYLERNITPQPISHQMVKSY